MRKLKLGLPLLVVMATTALVFSASGAGAPAQPKVTQLKVALIAPSAHNDLAFTQSMYAALNKMKVTYSFDVSVSENQFVVANAANIIRQYAEQGYDLVIAHGSQYGGTIQQLAPLFPKVSFAWGTAGDTFGQKNVFAYEAASQEGGYVQGYLAAMMSKTKVLGIIGPIAVGDAKLYVDGFAAGAKAAKKDVDVKISYTGSFSDPSLMSKQASQFLAQRADVLTGSSQSVVGAITVAKANKVPWFGTQWTQASLAPKQVVSSQIYDWTGVIKTMLTNVRAGKLGGENYVITLKNGGEKIKFNPQYKASKTITAAATRVIKGISNGTIKVPGPEQ
jgi:basic membrane lipoprotein Med (substrate-binding protein (PBP1-ABC) superfamily)